MAKKLLLVDAPNQAFRAYHAIQNDMRAPDGFPTRALYGFTRILKALIRDIRPDYVACVFDRGSSFRNALLPDYKGQRYEMPEDLAAQWGELEPLCTASGYTVLAREGFEADDIIGTLARRYGAEGVDVAIVSGDKDFCQLVDDRIHILDVMKGVEIDRDGVVERWGVPPEKVIDLLSLMGDTSDNVPGVPGVGPKKAAQFVSRYGSLDEVLAHAAEIGGKTGEAVAQSADAVRLARRLVTIDTDVPLDLTLDDLRVREPDVEELRRRLLRYNFKTLWNELGLGERTVERAVQLDHREMAVVWGPTALAELVTSLREAGRFALHVEGVTPEPWRPAIANVRFAWGERRASVPVDRAALEALRPVLEDAAVRKVGYDLKTAYKLLAARGVTLRGIDGDLMIADYMVVPEQKRALDILCQRWLERGYGARRGEDVECIQAIEPVVEGRLGASARVYRDIELPLIPVLAEMEIAGIGVDVDALARLSEELDARLQVVQREIHALAGEEFNINSTQQLAAILYDRMGLAAGKKTKTGRSTDADTLQKLQHPLADAVLSYRELYKLKNTYVEALPRAVNPYTRRIHTTFHQAVAATGRLSSNDPNLQNIPVRTEEGRRIRKCFVAAPGHVFLSADYSQIELRVLAHFCGEGALVESFRNDEDIHRRTASEIFGVAPALVSTEMRRAAKAINFGIVYGMGAFRLANDLRIPRAQAQAYIDGYFARYPQVRACMDRAVNQARETGCAETLFGRRRPVAGLDAGNPNDRAAAERVAINTPIQGTAADLIKIAMIRVSELLAGTGARMLLQVHDELVLEVPEGDVESLAPRVRAAMEGVAELAVPLKVDSGVGRSWDEAH